MKIIVNRGFNADLAGVEIIKNGKAVDTFGGNRNICDVDAQKGDEIAVKFKYLLQTAGGTTFTCGGADEIVYVCPTRLCKVWEWTSYKLFPALSLFLVVLWAVGVLSLVMQWVVVGMVVLTAVTIMALQFSQMLPKLKRKFFSVHIIK